MSMQTSQAIDIQKLEDSYNKVSKLTEEAIKYHTTNNFISIIIGNNEPIIITRKSKPRIFDILKESLKKNEREFTENILKDLSDKSWVEDLSYILEKDEEGNTLLKGRVLDNEELYLVKALSNMIEDRYGPWGIKPLLKFYENVEKNPIDRVKREIYRAVVLQKDFSITHNGMIIAYRRTKWEQNQLVKNRGKLDISELRNRFNEINDEALIGNYYEVVPGRDGALLASFRAATESTFCRDEGNIYENAVMPENIVDIQRLTKEGSNEETFYLKATKFLAIRKIEKEDLECIDGEKIWHIDLNITDNNGVIIRSPYNKETALEELKGIIAGERHSNPELKAKLVVTDC